MDTVLHVFPLLVVLASVPGVLCEYNYNATGLVLSSIAAFLLLVAVILLAMIGVMWHKWYMKRQFRRGIRRIPREVQERWLFGRRKQNDQLSPQFVHTYKPKSLIGEEILPALSPQPQGTEGRQYVITEATNPAVRTINPPPQQHTANRDEFTATYVPVNSTREAPTEIKSRQTQSKVVRYAPIHIHAATVDSVRPTSAVYGQSTSERTGRIQDVYIEDNTADTDGAVVNFEEEEDSAQTTTGMAGRSSQTNVLY